MKFTTLLIVSGLAASAQAQSISINLSYLTGITPIPGGAGSFTAFPPDPSISFGNITFSG